MDFIDINITHVKTIFVKKKQGTRETEMHRDTSERPQLHASLPLLADLCSFPRCLMRHEMFCRTKHSRTIVLEKKRKEKDFIITVQQLHFIRVNELASHVSS